jgi:hypothetical protein
MAKLLDVILWLIVTLFSPQAGLNEINNDKEN